MKELEKTYNPNQTEPKIYRAWERSGYFSPPRTLAKETPPPFVIALPPPNVTGSLHMGHALNSTLQDILIRWYRMKGVPTLWIPGTDHAGIATQNKVEQELAVSGKTRFDLGREKFIERVWEWKEKYGNIILEQLKKLGCSCDWSRTRFTMDDDYSRAVIAAFINYYNKGYIYRGERIVNWCPRCGTSLSDLELINRETKGKLWYIKYKFKAQNLKTKAEGNYIIVATTRPETMLGDTAVAVNPEDPRYKNLIGKKIILPLLGREIPLIADSAVEPDFGTGAVKVTPGADPTDFEIGQRHHLEIIKIVNENGTISSVGGPYAGLDRYVARKQVIKDLEAQGLIEKIEDYIYNVPLCYRCETVIEPLVSLQWFVKMNELIKPVIEAIKTGRVKFIPSRWAKVALDWCENIRDWCISRQIWWGHRLPVWYKPKGISGDQFSISKQAGEESVYVGEEPPEGWVQDEDVLDTWFSSALWPFATLGWPIACAQNKNEKTKNKKYCIPEAGTDLFNFYPNSISITDRGIINLWEVRMIFSGLEFMGEVPFREIYINPTVFNKQGKRMSKSLGTGVDPLELIEKYGADATRFGLAFQDTGTQDIKFGEEAILAGRNFANKIWNASRYVLMKLGNDKINLLNPESFVQTEEDRIIFEKTAAIIKSTNENLAKYRFGQACNDLYHFFWNDFCDVYIEKSKIQLENKEIKDSTKKLLLYTLLVGLKLIHPIMPHVTEAIYQALPMEDKKEFLMIESWPRDK